MTRGNRPPPRSEIDELKTAGRVINLLVWMVAAVVMVFSAITGAELLADHGVDKRLGLAGGIAVDAALVVALIGDRQLHRYGQSAPWGTALRWVTALFSLVLNCGQSFSHGDWGAVGLHAIFPVLLIVLTEASQGYQLAFSRAVLKARTEDAYRAEPVPSTKHQASVSTASGKDSNTAPRKSRDTAKRGEQQGASGDAISHRSPTKPKAKPTTTGQWDDELWSRAVEVTARYQKQQGRDPKLGEFHSELRISRNAASPLRNAALVAIAERGADAAKTRSVTAEHGPTSTEQANFGTERSTDARVVPLHGPDTASSDTSETADAR